MNDDYPMNASIAEDLRPLAVPIESVHLDPVNARTGHALDRIAASLSAYGQRKPIVINRSEGNKIEAGNGTWQAAKALGWSHIAAVFVEDDAMTAVGYAVADNRTGELSTWDAGVLQAISDSLDPDVVTGFEGDELAVLVAELGTADEGQERSDAEPQIDRAAELREAWGVEPGQLWRLPSRVEGQEHRLICGDCTDAAVVERVMGGEKAALFTSDPPYGVSYADKNEWLNSIDFGERIQTPIENDHGSIKDISAAVWLPAFSLALKHCCDTASFYLFMPQGGDQMMMMMMMMSEAGWTPRHELIWLKNNHVLGRVDYNYKHEPILYGWKQKGTHKFFGGFQTSVIECNKPQKSGLHPTTKPAELLERLIPNSTRAGAVVYDPFGGSGTTMVACENLSRQCRMIEIEPSYCAVILQRMVDAFGIVPELIENPASENISLVVAGAAEGNEVS